MITTAGTRACFKGKSMEYFCENHNLTELTDWSPMFSLREDLKQTMEWYKNNFTP